jgi:hypothetical protein
MGTLFTPACSADGTATNLASGECIEQGTGSISAIRDRQTRLPAGLRVMRAWIPFVIVFPAGQPWKAYCHRPLCR